MRPIDFIYINLLFYFFFFIYRVSIVAALVASIVSMYFIPLVVIIVHIVLNLRCHSGGTIRGGGSYGRNVRNYTGNILMLKKNFVEETNEEQKEKTVTDDFIAANLYQN